jgi:hypothetical protein
LPRAAATASSAVPAVPHLLEVALPNPLHADEANQLDLYLLTSEIQATLPLTP